METFQLRRLKEMSQTPSYLTQLYSDVSFQKFKLNVMLIYKQENYEDVSPKRCIYIPLGCNVVSLKQYCEVSCDIFVSL